MKFAGNFFENVNVLPLVIYQACNRAICEYESDGKSFWEIPDIKENLAKTLCFIKNEPDMLVDFVNNQCEK